MHNLEYILRGLTATTGRAKALTATRLLAAVLACVLLSGCIYDEIDEEKEITDIPFFLQLEVTVAGEKQTRADSNPLGGENGNYTETGSDDETTINNAVLMIYSKSLNSDALTSSDKVVKTFYFDSFEVNDNGNYTAKIKLSSSEYNALKGNTYKVAAITNVGDISSTFNGMILTSLRNYQYSEANWTETNGVCSNFVMSSISEETFTFPETTENGEYDFPTISVERLAARVEIGFDNSCWIPTIDYTLRGTNVATKGIFFPVYKLDPETKLPVTPLEDTGQRFLLTDITLMESYVGSEYIFKRTADNTSGDNTTYFGTETADANDKATNYVLSPNNTAESNYQNFKFTINTDISGKTTIINGKTPTKTKIVDGKARSYYHVAYTRENTNKAAHYTGLQLSGYFRTSNEPTSTDFRTNTSERDYSFPLRHSDPTGAGNETDPMHYGVVRNNIYRVYIDKIFSDSKYVYVRWYYYRNNGQDEVEYTTVAFNSMVQPGGSNDYPNDAPPRPK